MLSIQEDKTFIRLTTEAIKANSSFENCTFISCDLGYACLDNIVFIDCVFRECNLLLANIQNTGFQQVNFIRCKLSGVNFSKCRDFLFKVNFDECILDNAIFYQKKNKKTWFKDCAMVETDFTEADLTDTAFINCNLQRALFSRTILKGADLRTSYNFTINPNDNIIKKALFSLHGLPGLLSQYDIEIEN